jgi:putative oxidoreductase
MTGQQALGAFLLRLILGVVFVMHGYYGFTVVTPSGAAGLITRMGYPADVGQVLAWYLIVAHALGGLLILLGLWTRWAALAQVPIMASAVFLLHLPQGFFMRGLIVDAAAGRAIAGGYEFALTILVATLALALLGPGALALDRARARSLAVP